MTSPASIILHLLNASGKLDQLRYDIELSFDKDLPAILALLPVRYVDVVVQPSPHVIPEIGIAGNCYRSDIIYISVDPNNQNINRNFQEEFVAQLAHELHHALRMRGPGYGETLQEALVSEGLACHFEAAFRQGEYPFYATSLDNDTVVSLENTARDEFHSTAYDHRAWFFGACPTRLPRFAGYSLGFALVDRYIKRHNKAAAELHSVSAGEIFGNG